MTPPTTPHPETWENKFRNGWKDMIDVEFLEDVIADVSTLLAAERQRERDRILAIAEGMDTKKHICRFNDGEQKCECYLAALSDLIAKVREEK